MTRSRGSKDTVTRSLAVVLVPLFVLSLMLPGIASATASVTATTGASGISSDTSSTGGTNAGTSLTGPTIVEGANRDIETGTIILQLPTGFAYKVGTISTSVTRIEGSSSC